MKLLPHVVIGLALLAIILAAFWNRPGPRELAIAKKAPSPVVRAPEPEVEEEYEPVKPPPAPPLLPKPLRPEPKGEPELPLTMRPVPEGHHWGTNCYSCHSATH